MHIFYDSAEISGDPSVIFERLRRISRDHYLGEPQSRRTRRWLYYSTNLTRLSIPEMAKQLGVSEGQVYSDLSHFQFSIPKAFGSMGEMGDGGRTLAYESGKK